MFYGSQQTFKKKIRYFAFGLHDAALLLCIRFCRLRNVGRGRGRHDGKNFEYFSDNDGKYLIAGADSWTNSTESNGSGTSASSSVSKSGIVDTSFDWGDATKGFYQAYADYLKYDQMQEDDPDNPELDDAEYYTDIDNYYDIPGWDIVKAELEKEDSSVDLTDADTIVSTPARTGRETRTRTSSTRKTARTF